MESVTYSVGGGIGEEIDGVEEEGGGGAAGKGGVVIDGSKGAGAVVGKGVVGVVLDADGAVSEAGAVVESGGAVEVDGVMAASVRQVEVSVAALRGQGVLESLKESKLLVVSVVEGLLQLRRSPVWQNTRRRLCLRGLLIILYRYKNT